MEEKICAIFGHNEFIYNDKLKEKLYDCFENLIKNFNVHYFYIGTQSNFYDFALEILTKLKTKYPHIMRYMILEDEKYYNRPWKMPSWYKNINIDEYKFIPLTNNYWAYRLLFRNYAMIDNSDFCLFYLTNNNDKSGTFKAYKYALKKKKAIIKLP